MRAYLLCVCGAVILSALITIVLPQGKTGKFINGILKLFCVAIMLTPLIGLVREGNFDFWQGDGTSSVALDKEYIDYAFSERAEQISEEIRAAVEKEIKITVEVGTEWESADYAFKIQKVTVKIKNFGMYGKDEHIMIIEQVRKRVSEMIKMNEESVFVYEGE